MKKIITYLFVLLISNIYAQCDDYNQSQCSNDNNCEWIENIETEWCSGNNQAECFAQEECYWYPGGIYLGSQCTGGSYEVDNSYCQEIEMLECSEMNETECSSDDVCEWVEDIEIGQCSQFDNSENSCTDYPGECFWDEDITYASCNYPNSGICNSYAGCYWDCYYGYCDCYGQQQIVDTECIGQYETDNSYCQEIVMPECSEMEQSNCEDDFGCDWIVDIDVGSCYSLTQNQCIANSNCNWSCGFYHGSCAGCCWYECDGGTYQIDNSYCEEIPYTQGDINNDLVINVLDVIQSVNLILYSEYNVIVDMNYDELINVQDIILLINLIL